MAVNLNTAGYEELMTIPGVGEKRATGILALREKGVHVNYEVVEELAGNLDWRDLVAKARVTFGNFESDMAVGAKGISFEEDDLNKAKGKSEEGPIEDSGLNKAWGGIGDHLSKASGIWPGTGGKHGGYSTEDTGNSLGLLDLGAVAGEKLDYPSNVGGGEVDEHKQRTSRKCMGNINGRGDNKPELGNYCKESINNLVQERLLQQMAALEKTVGGIVEQMGKMTMDHGGRGNTVTHTGARMGVGAQGGEVEGGGRGWENLKGGWLKMKLPKYEGEILWGTYIKQVNAVFNLYGCNDEMVCVFKLIEAFRGRAMTYFATLPDAVASSYGSICEAMGGRFGDNETDSVARMKLHYVQQRHEESLGEFGERVQALHSKGYSAWGGEEQGAIAVEFFLRGLKDKRLAMAVVEKEPRSLGEAIRLVQRSEAHQSLIGGDFKVRQTSEVDGDRPSEVSLPQRETSVLEGNVARITGGEKSWIGGGRGGGGEWGTQKWGGSRGGGEFD